MSTKASEEETSSHLDESDIGDEFNDDDVEKLGYFPGKTVTLQMLLGAHVLQPGKGAMTIEYLGQKFVGDLLADGKIKSQETETIFCSPSAWAIYCKRIINPDKKSGCGWASVKYKGRKLDAYKAAYYRKQQKERDQHQKEDLPPGEELAEETEEDKTAMEPPPVRRNIVAHNTISNRNVMHDSNTLIEAVPFTSLGKMQPFLVTVSTSTLLVMDFHCHLTNHEVCGYLGGTWDINAHNLSITHAFPCRNTRHDRDKAALCELQIQKLMIKKNINLVGWYHSHPRFPVQPTLRDCDAQLDYQIRMRGPTEASYIPCIGFICSPYDEQNTALESNVMSFWVTPPPENRPSEYGRPMLMTYTLVQDETLSEDVKEEMMLTVDYYKQFKRELINFQAIYGVRDVPYIEKLRRSLSPRFPRDSTSGHFWNWVRELLGLDPEEIPEVAVVVTTAPEPPIAAPPTAPAKLGEESSSGPPIVNLVNSAEEMETKNEDDFDSEMGDSDVISLKDEDGKGPAVVGGPAIAVPSLQAQLKRPSGLNMTPSPLSSALVVLPTNLSQTAPPGQPQGAPATAPAAATNLSMNNNQAPSSVLPPPSSVANHQASTGHHGTHGTITVAGSSLMNATNTSSPRDSPITIPSNSASPAKFEVPVRASPSPAKSDSSSCRSRTRNSPAPSPGKLSIGDILGSSSSVGGGAGNRNSPTLSSLIGGSGGGGGGGGAGASSSNIHDLYAATFASLGTALPANLLSQEYAALFGQGQGGGSGSGGGNSKQRDEYGLSALTALAQVAAASGLSNSQINETLLHSLNRSMSSKASSGGGGQGGSSSSPSTITSNSGAGCGGSGGAGGLPAIPNMKEFMQQLEKGNLSLLMQSQYGANPLLGMGSGPGMGGVGGGTPPPPTGGGKSGSGRSSKSRSKANQAAAAAAAAVAAQQQLQQAQQALLQHQSMMDYADFTSKFDQSKLVDLMKTPEYSQMLLQQAQALGSLGSEISIVKKPSGKGAGSGASASSGANNNRDSSGHGPIGGQGNNSTSSSSYGGGSHSSAIGTSSSIGAGSKKESAQDLITKLRTMFSTDSYLPPVPTAADINLLVEQSQKYPVIQQILNSGNLDDIQVLLKAQSLSNNALDFASFLGGGPGGTNGSSMAAGHGDGGSGKGGKGGSLKDDASSNNIAAAAAAAAAMNPYLGVSNLSSLFEPIQRMGGSASGGGGGGKGSKADKASKAAAAAAAAAVSSASITNPTDMLNSLFTSAAHGGAGGSADMNALLYSQAAAAAAAAGGKGTAADLNLLFGGGSLTSNSGSSGASSGGGGGPGMSAGAGSGGTGSAGGKAAAAAAAQASLDYLSMFPNFSAAAAAAKLPDMSSLFSQEKYEIPDPLSKATLEANNMYLAPSASLLKLHQEAFNSMLMKPPKSSSSSTSSSGKIETPPPSASIIPSPGSRSTPTKSANRESPSLGSAGGGGGGGGGGNSKYNFSAVDLAVSSVVPLAASSPLGGASGAADLSRKAPQTPPVDMSRSSPAIPATATSPGAGSSSSSSGILPPYKKRMEFASIADLVAAPPAKIPKMSTENLDP